MSEPEHGMLQPSPEEDKDLGGVVAELAGVLGHENFNRGDLAGLRRIDADRLLVPAYWRLLLRRVPERFRRGSDQEKAWALILQSMAIMAPDIHTPGRSLGKVMARLDREGNMETRFIRFLRCSGPRLADQVRLLARLLAAQKEAVDWKDLAELLLLDAERRPSSVEALRRAKRREELLRKLARDFYMTAEHDQSASRQGESA